MPEWIAYTRTNYGKTQTNTTVIKKRAEQRPAGFSGMRHATVAEIAEEIARREAAAQQLRERKAFENRPEVIAARSIMSIIEFDLENVIDSLPPEDWIALHNKLKSVLKKQAGHDEAIES